MDNRVIKPKRSRIRWLGKKFAQGLRTIGPGFVTGAADNDPSGIGTYAMAGTMYGLSLLWICPFVLPFMFAMQEMCARIGIVTSSGLSSNMKRIFPKTIIIAPILSLVIANIINIGANIAIMASAAQLVTGLNFKLLAIVMTITIILMEVFISYHVYSRILLIFALFLFSYVIVAFIVSQNWINVLKHAVFPTFSLERNFIVLATGLLGTTISPYLFFWQTSHEVENKLDNFDHDHSSYHIKKLLSSMRLDTFIGMFFAQTVTFFVMVTCFSTLHVNGITNIATASDAAAALKPLAGQWAYLLFSIGIIGAGFLGIPVIAGSAAYPLAEIFEKPEGLSHPFRNAMFFYSIIALSSLIGLAINFVGINPVKALVFAAVINAMAAVPIIACVIILANKTKIMHSHKNGILSNVLSLITFTAMLVCSIVTIYFFIYEPSLFA